MKKLYKRLLLTISVIVVGIIALVAIAISVFFNSVKPEPGVLTPLRDAPLARPNDQRPNIVYILADDLGYADLGVFGSEIPTPNLDALAKQGMLLTDFHTSLTCSPTRSMLMSGTDNHVAGLGVMSKTLNISQLFAPGYETHLNFRVASLADLMTDAGYNTYMTGKWHLGNDKKTSPRARGFKRSFVSIDGAAHLGALPWIGLSSSALAPYRDGDNDNNEIIHVDDDFYSTRFYTDHMIEYIERDRDDDRPFFAYLAYTAPHWPLQAPKESIAKFSGWYDEGYEALYQKRFKKMQELELIPQDAVTFDDSVWTKRWNDLSDDEKKISARKMEIYAAMVNDLDTYVGKFIDYLKEIGEYDNTFIIFSSDNGAHPNAGGFDAWVALCCDNSYDNLGSATSYVLYGPDWATASTVAHRRHKATAFEGGIQVPAFAWYPKMIASEQVSDGFSTVMDLMPTFLELAESKHPGASYNGHKIVPIKGRSMIPLLNGNAKSIHSENEYTGWELYGHRGIRQGDWKITWDASARDKAKWMLFNLADDPAEQYDLSDSNPQKLTEMIALWDKYVEENGVVY